ncbi:MAG: RNA polymerase sigma factor [Alloprevotella sp.]|nr:RNA polymerase sigma factor [Alloprevotella sp.]
MSKPRNEVEKDREDGTLLPAFRRLHARLRLMAARIVGRDEADDALQEAFLRLWQRRHGMQGEAEAAALLWTTARNVSLDIVRNRTRLAEVPLEDADGAYERDAEAVDADADEREEDVMLRVEALMQDRLTPLQRDILHRREVCGETYAAIARSLDMQEPAVRMQLSRARKTIRNAFYDNETQ